MFKKILLNFILALSFFSIIVFLMFYFIFSNYTLNIYKDNLIKDADKISVAFAPYFEETKHSMHNGHGMGNGNGNGNGQGAYIKFVNDISDNDIWILDDNLNSITFKNSSTIDLSEYIEKNKSVFEKSLQGSTQNIYHKNEALISAISPIKVNGDIQGLVVLQSPVKLSDQLINNSIFVLMISILISIPLSAIIAYLLSKRIVKPIMKLQTGVFEVSKGNYDITLDNNDSDEIGDLSRAFNAMSYKVKSTIDYRIDNEKRMQKFFTNTSHELKTPIAVIKGFVESIDLDDKNNSMQNKEYLYKAIDELQYLEILTNDLLELNKMSSQEYLINLETISLSFLLDDVIRSMQKIASQKNITIVKELSEIDLSINGDYTRLKQALITIIDNAIKFSNKNEEIIIKGENKNNSTIIEIIDNGVGMNKDDQDHLFDRFYHQRSELNKKGSGLGLSIAKEIVKKHNGSIKVNSKINEGTTISIILNN